MSGVLHVYSVVRKGGEIGGVRLLASRCETFEGIQYVLASMRNDPVTGEQSVTALMGPNTSRLTVSLPISRPLPAALPASRQSEVSRIRRDILGRVAHYKWHNWELHPCRCNHVLFSSILARMVLKGVRCGRESTMFGDSSFVARTKTQRLHGKSRLL
jgi:hypothetical protein